MHFWSISPAVWERWCSKTSVLYTCARVTEKVALTTATAAVRVKSLCTKICPKDTSENVMKCDFFCDPRDVIGLSVRTVRCLGEGGQQSYVAS